MDDSRIYSTEDAASIAPDGKETSEKYGTLADRRDMDRMGKTQKLRVGRQSGSMFPVLTHRQRNFGFFSIFGFSMILLSTWEMQLAYAIVVRSNIE